MLPQNAQEKRSLGRVLILMSAVGIGMWLRCMGLGENPLWLDEAYTVLLAQRSLGEILARAAADLHPPGFYLLLKLWLGAGNNEILVRIPSVVAGVLTILVAEQLVREIDPPSNAPARLLQERSTQSQLWISLFVGLAVAVAPILIHYSQECRMYSIAVFLVCILLWQTVMLERQATNGRALGWIVNALMLMYIHNMGIFAVIASISALLLQRRIQGQSVWDQRLTAMVVVCGLLWLPWAVTVFNQFGSGAAEWIQEMWVQSEASSAMFRSFQVSTVTFDFPYYLVRLANAFQGVPEFLPTALLGVIGTTLAGILSLVGVARAIRERGAILERTCIVFLIFLWVIPFAVSILGKPIYLVGRYDVLGLGPVLLLVGSGLSAISGKWNRFRLPIILGVMSLWAGTNGLVIAGYSRIGIISSERQAVTWLLDHATPGDVTVVPGLAVTTVRYYAQRDGYAGSILSCPPELGDIPGWFNEGEWLSSARRQAAPLNSMRLAINDALSGGTVNQVHLALNTKSSEEFRTEILDWFRREFGTPVVSLQANGGDYMEIYTYKLW